MSGEYGEYQYHIDTIYEIDLEFHVALLSFSPSVVVHLLNLSSHIGYCSQPPTSHLISQS